MEAFTGDGMLLFLYAVEVQALSRFNRSREGSSSEKPVRGILPHR